MPRYGAPSPSSADTRRPRISRNCPTTHDPHLRRTAFLDDEQRPDDYAVRYNSRTVGRILRLDEAKAAFRAAWERPVSQKIADEICSA
jgi:hypothetical protein